MPEHRPPHDSLHELAEAIVEATGRHKAVDSDPPAVRWLQKWWWKISLAAVAETMSHILHEIIASGLHHR